MGILHSGDGEQKGTRTTTPNHADETQPAQRSRTGGPAGGTGSWDNSTQTLRGGLDATPAPVVARGRHPSGTVTMETEARGWSIEIMWRHASSGVTLSGASLSRKQCTFPGGQWRGRGAPESSCRAGGAGPSCPLPFLTASGRAGGQDPEDPGASEGKGPAQRDGGGHGPHTRDPSAGKLRSPQPEPESSGAALGLQGGGLGGSSTERPSPPSKTRSCSLKETLRMRQDSRVTSSAR